MKEIVITDVKEFVDLVNTLPNNYIYRGHSSIKWQLKSTLERVLGASYVTSADRFEKWSLLEFSSRYHLYDHENLKPETKLQWLALLQHYGAPTRLLDFSTSPYVALYFALEFIDTNTKDDMAIFAIDFRALLNESITYIKGKDKTFTYSYSDALANQDKIFEENIDRFSYDILWITEPQISNIRIDRQAGCFLLSGNNSKAIDQLLGLPIYSSVDVKKIIIPISLYKNVYELLKRINLTSKNIYGDLPGLAKSIKMEMIQYS